MLLPDTAFMESFYDKSLPVAIEIGTRIIGALALWIVGRFVIAAVLRGVRGGLERRRLEPTLIRYINSIMSVVLKLVLFILVLGVFGVETTTFAGLLAAAGIAIGMAWSGLLGNFAAGVFLVVLRPFKVGDMITGGGTTGVVQEIGLFVTTIDTADNICTFVGNSKILGDSSQNYSANPHRRVDLTAQLAHTVDADDAIRRLRLRLAAIPHVLAVPAPVVELLDANLAGPVLAVRPSTAPEHYWDVYFATAHAIRAEFAAAGYPTPASHTVVRSAA